MGFERYLISELIDEIAMGPFGSNIKVDCFVADGVPVLNGSNLTGVKLNDDSFRYVTFEKSDSLRKANARRGDIVITHRGTLGQISYIPLNSRYERYVISQSQFRIRCNEKVLPEYLTYYFHTRVGQHKLLSNKSQVGVPALARPSTTFQNIEVEIPDRCTQQKIAKILSSLDDKIKLNNRLSENLEAQMVEYYVHEQSNTSWDSGTLDDVLEFHDKKRSPLSSIQRKNMSKIYPYYGATTIVDYVENYIFDGLYILISEDGANVVDDEGYPLTQYAYGKFWVNNHAHVVKGKGDISEALCYILIKRTNLRSIVTGAAQPKINQFNLKNFRVTIPHSHSINKLNQLLEPMLNQLIANKEENIRLAQLRDTLLPRLMSGEIDVDGVEV